MLGSMWFKVMQKAAVCTQIPARRCSVAAMDAVSQSPDCKAWELTGSAQASEKPARLTIFSKHQRTPPKTVPLLSTYIYTRHRQSHAETALRIQMFWGETDCPVKTQTEEAQRLVWADQDQW